MSINFWKGKQGRDLPCLIYLPFSLSLSFFFSTFLSHLRRSSTKTKRNVSRFFLSFFFCFPLSCTGVCVHARKRKCMHFHRKRSAPLVDEFVVEFGARPEGFSRNELRSLSWSVQYLGYHRRCGGFLAFHAYAKDVHIAEDLLPAYFRASI